MVYSTHSSVQKLTVMVGEPLNFTQWIAQQRAAQTSAVIMRRRVTNLLQEKLLELKEGAELLHKQLPSVIKHTHS